MSVEKNISIHISDRSHVNLTLNVYNCGNQDLELEQVLRPDHYIFYFVKEGKGYVTQRQATHKVEAGQAFVIFPNTDARIKSEHRKAMNITWVAFSGYLVERYLSRAHLTVYEPVFEAQPDDELERMFDELVEASTRMPNRYCKIMSRLYSIFAYLLDHASVEPAPVAASPEYFLFRALDFIDINYQDDISVEDIAASAGGNRKSLYAAFKNLTGFPPRTI